MPWLAACRLTQPMAVPVYLACSSCTCCTPTYTYIYTYTYTYTYRYIHAYSLPIVVSCRRRKQTRRCMCVKTLVRYHVGTAEAETTHHLLQGMVAPVAPTRRPRAGCLRICRRLVVMTDDGHCRLSYLVLADSLPGAALVPRWLRRRFVVMTYDL